MFMGNYMQTWRQGGWLSFYTVYILDYGSSKVQPIYKDLGRLTAVINVKQYTSEKTLHNTGIFLNRCWKQKHKKAITAHARSTYNHPNR